MASDPDSPTILLVATRKGGFLFFGDAERRHWRLDGPHFLGSQVNDVVLDPRDGRTLLLAAKAGHLGPTVYRGRLGVAGWSEAVRPPAFAKAAEGAVGRAVEYVFCFVPGGARGTWYAGTSPVGLFRSIDGGAIWEGVAGFNEGLYPTIAAAVMEVPDGSILHGILVDPRDAAHLYIALSTGGVFESLDAGATWRPLNRGVAAEFLPDPDAGYGHDPHAVALHPMLPDRVYQQNHCGLYRLDRPAEEWQRIGRNLPTDVGDVGFPLALHPRDPDTLWVFPMDGTDVWPRTPPGGRPAVFNSRDGGATWQRQDAGLPQQAWFGVKRQALYADAGDPVGVYFGTSSGELYGSRDEGAHWQLLAAHLPHILSVAAAGGT